MNAKQWVLNQKPAMLETLGKLIAYPTVGE